MSLSLCYKFFAHRGVQSKFLQHQHTMKPFITLLSTLLLCSLVVNFTDAKSEAAAATAAVQHEDPTNEEVPTPTTAKADANSNGSPQVSNSVSHTNTVITTEEDTGDGKGPHTKVVTSGAGEGENDATNGNASSVIPPQAVAAMTAWRNPNLPSNMFGSGSFWGPSAGTGSIPFAAAGDNGPDESFTAAGPGARSGFPPPGFIRPPVFPGLPPRFPPGFYPDNKIQVPTQKPYREPKITRRRRKRAAAAFAAPGPDVVPFKGEGLAGQMGPTNLANEYAAFNLWY